MRCKTKHAVVQVRYGAVMAVGFACAGTGLKGAIELLQPMTKDAVDFVRQGAFIALAMVLIQVSEAQEPAVTELRNTLEKLGYCTKLVQALRQTMTQSF